MSRVIFKNDFEISFSFSILAHLVILLLIPAWLKNQHFLPEPPSIIEVEVVRFLPRSSPRSSLERPGETGVETEVFEPVSGLKDIVPKRLYVADPSLFKDLKEREPKKSNKAGLIHEEPIPFDFEEKVEVGKVEGEIFKRSEPIFNKEMGREELKSHKEVVLSSLPGRHKEGAKEVEPALKGKGKGEGEGNLPYSAQVSKGPVTGRKFYWDLPKVPEWVEKEGISLSGELKFWVFPDGSVDPNIQVIKTSGHFRVDKLFSDALKIGRCSPLAKGEEKEWGILSFKIELK